MRAFLLLSMITFASACTSIPPSVGDGVKINHIENIQLKKLLAQGIAIVDVHRPEEWKELGVVKGSHKVTLFDKNANILPDFEQKLTTIAPNKHAPVIIICRTGSRTRFDTRILAGMGYTNIYNVTYGITGWILEGNPTVGKSK